MFFYFLV